MGKGGYGMKSSKLQRSSFQNLISYTYLTFLAIFAAFPLFWIIVSSIKSPGELSSNPTAILPKKISFDYYFKVLNELKFSNNVANSVLISLGTTVVTIIISSLCAYGIIRFFPRFGKIMTRILITTYMFPPILLVIPYSMIISKVGLSNNRIGLIITYLSFSIPFAVWLLIGFFRGVPLEIEEAAAIDGAGRLRIFTTVVLPIVAPGVVATAIYAFINAWNEFLFALILTNSSSKMTVSVALSSLAGAEVLDWGVMMAASVVVVLPSIVFFMIIQNKIAGGLAQGSIK